MPFDFLGFVAGAFATDIRDSVARHLLGNRLERDAHAAVEAWGAALPDGLRGASHIDFGRALVVAPDAAGDAPGGAPSPETRVPRAARQRLAAAVRDQGLPDVTQWAAALVEAWEDLRAQVRPEEWTAFLRLPRAEAADHLSALARRLDEACVQNEAMLSVFQAFALRRLLAARDGGPTRFGEVELLAHDVDRRILRSVRDHRHLCPPEILDEFRHLMDKYLLDGGWDVSRFSSALRSGAWMAEVLAEVPPPSMRLRVDRDRQAVELTGPDFAFTVEGAQLLWECNCAAPLFDRAGAVVARVRRRRQCPVHSRNDEGARAARAFGTGLVEVEADGTRVLWRNGPEFWPASMDSILMAGDLRTSGVLRGVQSVVDLGSGTGFLGIAAARAGGHVRRVVFSDWLLTPVFYSALNWWRSRPPAGVTAEFRLGLNTDWSHPRPTSESADLLVCNPPYLPLPREFEGIGLSSTVAGTDLLTHVIAAGHRVARRVVVSFSLLARPEAEAALGRVGRRLRPLGPARRLPFRVVQALEHPGYVAWLLRDRGLQFERDGYFQLWHDVQTFEVE